MFCEESKCGHVSCMWHCDTTKVHQDFFQYAECMREEVCYELYYGQVFVQLCIHVNWNVFLYHTVSSCCCWSWINPFSSSSISLLFWERLFTELLPWGQLHLLLEFVSPLLFHCSAKPFIVLLYLLNSLPGKKPYIHTGKFFWGMKLLMKVFVLQNWVPDPLLILGSGRDSIKQSVLQWLYALL